MSTLAEQWIQQGLQQGLQQGMQQAFTRTTLRSLRRRFGSLDENRQKRVSSLPAEKLDQLGEELFDFNTIDDLDAWLSTREEESDSNTLIH